MRLDRAPLEEPVKVPPDHVHLDGAVRVGVKRLFDSFEELGQLPHDLGGVDAQRRKGALAALLLLEGGESVPRA